MSIAPTSPLPTWWDLVSRTDTGLPASGIELLETAGLDTTDADGVGEAGAVEADAAPLDVLAVAGLAVGGEEAAADDATGVAVGVLACLEPELLHAVANVASVTRAAARRYARDDVGTGLLWLALVHHETHSLPARLPSR